jgi:hypothetical protein
MFVWKRVTELLTHPVNSDIVSDANFYADHESCIWIWKEHILVAKKTQISISCPKKLIFCNFFAQKHTYSNSDTRFVISIKRYVRMEDSGTLRKIELAEILPKVSWHDYKNFIWKILSKNASGCAKMARKWKLDEFQCTEDSLQRSQREISCFFCLISFSLHFFPRIRWQKLRQFLFQPIEIDKGYRLIFLVFFYNCI